MAVITAEQNHRADAPSENSLSGDVPSGMEVVQGGGESPLLDDDLSQSPESPDANYDEQGVGSDVLGSVLAAQEDGDDGLVHGSDAFHDALRQLDEPDEAEEEAADDPTETVEAEQETEANEAEEESDETDDDEPYDPVAEQERRLKEAGIDIGDADPVDFLVSEMEANKSLVAAFSKDGQLREVARLAVQEGMTLKEALAEIDYSADENDPEIIRAQERKKLREEQYAERLDAASEKAAQDEKAFRTSRDFSDKQMADFKNEIRPYIYGTAEGTLPSDFMEVMWKGLHFDEELAAAKEAGEESKLEAETQGRNAAIREQRQKKQRRGDGIPNGRDGTTREARSPREQSLQKLAHDLQTDDVFAGLL